MKKGIIAAVVVIVLGAGATFGYFYWEANSYTPPQSRSRFGVLMENLVPPNTSLAVSFNPTDENQRKLFLDAVWNPFLKPQLEFAFNDRAQMFIENEQDKEIVTQLRSIIGGKF